MKWSLKLGKLVGINVYLHFTFLLLLAFLGFVYWRTTHNVEATLQGVAFIIALFGCVVLHELGHALMARRYGIKTRDITLLPSVASRAWSRCRRSRCRSSGSRWPGQR